MLRFMEEKNLFDYWRDARTKQEDRFFVDFSRRWMPSSELKKYRERINVVYLLYNDESRQLYVGKANKLGSRLKESDGRIGMKRWNKFMFFEIDPKYAHVLEDIEAYTIRTFASLLENDVRMVPLKARVNKLVNRQLRVK